MCWICFLVHFLGGSIVTMSCSIWPPLRQGIKFWNGQYNIFKNTTYLKKRNALPNFKNILETFFATNHCDQKRSILHLLQGGGVGVVISYVTGLFQFEGKPEIFYLNPPSPYWRGPFSCHTIVLWNPCFFICSCLFDLETFVQLLPFSFPLLSPAFGGSVLGEGGRMPKVFWRKWYMTPLLPSQHDLWNANVALD